MVTIKDIAKELGIAPSTVSMALNDRKGISPELRLKVKEAAKRFGYMPYIKARQNGMYRKTPRVISIIYPKCDTHITESVQCGIDKVIKESDYHKIRYTVDLYSELNAEKDKERFIETILENTAAGAIILFSITLSETTVAKLTKKGVHLVFLNTYMEYGNCVYVDNLNASYKATKSLIELGYNKIGIIIPDQSMGVEWNDRLEGYKTALKDSNIEFNPDYIVYENDFSSLRSAAYSTKYLIEKHPEINAILYGSDIFAFGGLKILKEMGKKIPDDIAIIGFDDMPIDEVLQPSLSSVRFPLIKMGELGAKMLLNRIMKNNFNPERIVLNEAEIILRGTCVKEYNKKWL